jgi:hypothetical protein
MLAPGRRACLVCDQFGHVDVNGERCDLVCLDLPRAQALRGRLLAWGGVAWHGLELAIALAAGIAAGSITLIGFGADSLIEALAGGIVLWRKSPP